MPSRHSRGRHAAPRTPSRHRGRRAALRALLRRALRSGAVALERTWRAFQRRRDARVEVLLVDRARARAIQREVRAGLRRLRRALGPARLDDLAVIVQQTVGADRPQVGCHDFLAPQDDGHVVLVRLALSVDGQKVAIDELLATLADQCVAMARVRRAEPVVQIGPAHEPFAGPDRARSDE